MLKSENSLLTSHNTEFNILNKESFTEPKSVDTLIDEMLQEREDVNDGKPVNIADTPIDAPELIPDDPPDKKIVSGDIITGISDKPKLSEKKARFEARFIARNANRLNAFGCGILADDDDDKFKADNEDLKELEEVFFEWRKDSDEPLPLWMNIVVSCGLVFGPKWKQAFSMRKYKKQIELQNTEIENLKKKLKKQESEETKEPKEHKKSNIIIVPR